MRISVIVPTYNNGAYLEEALDSILRQTVQCCEIIVVDDGSTDDTRQVAESYGDAIRYIHQVNQGLAVARNTGIRNSTGEFFTFLDGDDIWEPENLAIKLQLLEADPTLGAVFSNFFLFNAQGVLSADGIKVQYPLFSQRGQTYDDIFEERQTLHLGNGRRCDVYEGNLFRSILFGNFINSCSILIRRECQRRVGLFHPELRTQQDYEYWLRFSRYHRMAYVDLPLVHYRRHATQLTDRRHLPRIISTVVGILEPYYRDAVHDLDPRLRSAFVRRYSRSYRQLGLAYLGVRENGKARRAFRRSFSIYRGNLLSLMYYCFAFLPSAITFDSTLYIKKRIAG